MFNLILAEILKELADDIKKDSSLAVLSRCESESDIHSFLRDRLFRTDVRTAEFLDKIRGRLSAPGKLAAKEMSESDFIGLLYECLEKTSKSKNSKFGITHHYFSPERDLVVNIKSEDKNEATFRVLAVKTS